MTSKDLYEFCYRADTVGKVAMAERWIREHRHIMSRELFDDLIETLDLVTKRIFFRNFIKSGIFTPEQYAQVITEDGQIFVIHRESGELVMTDK